MRGTGLRGRCLEWTVVTGIGVGGRNNTSNLGQPQGQNYKSTSLTTGGDMALDRSGLSRFSLIIL